jgi:hypothetical protein
VHDAHRRQRPKTGPDRGPAYAYLRREITFGREPVAAPQRPALDQGADVRHDLLGAAFAHPVAGG